MDSDRDLCLTEHRVFRSLASLSSVLTVLPHEKSEKSLRFKNLRFFQICRIFQKPWQSNPKVFRCRGDSTFFLLPYFSLFVANLPQTFACFSHFICNCSPAANPRFFRFFIYRYLLCRDHFRFFISKYLPTLLCFAYFSLFYLQVTAHLCKPSLLFRILFTSTCSPTANRFAFYL